MPLCDGYGNPIAPKKVSDLKNDAGFQTAEQVREAVKEGMDDIPTDEHINNLINNALGVIENGTY